MKTVYLSLGSNLGDRHVALQRAVDRLNSNSVRIVRASSIYETEPVDLREQGWFLNMALEAQTRLFPIQLLGRLQRIEGELGRKRVVAKGPRVIDIDLLLYGQSVIECAQLQVPHPRLHVRRFVLAPLAELAPDLRHPVLRRRITDLLNDVRQQVVKKKGLALALPPGEVLSPG